MDAEAGVQQRLVHVSMAGDTMLVDAAVAVGVCVCVCLCVWDRMSSL